MRSLIYIAVFFLLTIGYGQSQMRFSDWSAEDLARPWCAVRPGDQCCKGRQDDCTVPLHGTLCYCDEFCNATALDCCPDFWMFCLGIQPRRPTTTPIPRGDIPPDFGSGDVGSLGACYKNGNYYPVGATITENCNQCTCLDEGPFSDQVSWSCSKNICLLRADQNQAINFGNYGWRASNYSFMWGLTLADGIKYRLGTFYPAEKVFRMQSLHPQQDESLPEHFDARQKWPGMITGIQDQRDCGSSWAFSTIAVASDRLAIGSSGEIRVELSPQNLLSCVGVESNNCTGGNIDQAWWYMRRFGSVTEDCYPYKARVESCRIPRVGRPNICPSGKVFKDHMMFKMTPPHRIQARETEIMKQIYQNGPLQAIFTVKEDFFAYRSGIYRHTGVSQSYPHIYQQTGYHSVRILGWGVDFGVNGQRTKYWLCANSWGSNWGENGYFRILRGEDECGIESFVISAWPRLPRRYHSSRRARRHMKGKKFSELLFSSKKKQ